MPPLPPRLPGVSIPFLKLNSSTRRFYKACSQGNLPAARRFAETSKWKSHHHIQVGLDRAAEAQQTDVARCLLGKGAQLTGHVLDSAFERPTLQFFKFLVEEQNWHPNQASVDGHVALYSCVRNEELLLYLLDKGANPNLGPPVLSEGGTPTDRLSGITLESAARCCEPRIFDLLLERGAKLEYATPLHSAAMAHSAGNDRKVMIQHLLEIGVNINGDPECYRRCPYRQERTPLSAMVNFNCRSTAELLLELGADPNTTEAKPRWFLDLVTRIKQQKGEETFWKDVNDLKARGQKQKVAYPFGWRHAAANPPS